MASPEMRFIIALLRTRFHSAARDELHHLAKQVSWELFMSRVKEHGVEGLIYRRLKTSSLLEIIPPTICGRLELRYYETLARNLMLMQGLKEVIREFNSRGISLLIMQGMAILEDAYPAIGDRPINDIDLLIKEEEFAEVRAAMASLRYLPVKNYPYLFVKGALVVDTHTDVVNASRIKARRRALTIPTGELWRDSAPLGQDGGKRTLSLEDTLLTLCAHLQKHSYSRLIWFMDIGLILQRHGNEINWPNLLEKALRYNLCKPLLMVLSQLKFVFHLEPPADIYLRLCNLKLNPLDKAALSRLKEGREVGRIGELLYAFSLKGPLQQAGYLFETAFPRREVMAQIYGLPSPHFAWFAYPIRLSQLLATGIQQAARLRKS